jgi:deoxyribose-phosphate aldolase
MRQIEARIADRPRSTSLARRAALMSCIDHSLLRPKLTGADVEDGVELAMDWETATLCCRC